MRIHQEIEQSATRLVNILHDDTASSSVCWVEEMQLIIAEKEIVKKRLEVCLSVDMQWSLKGVVFGFCFFFC